MQWNNRDDKTDEKYKKCIELYGYLQKDEYSHKREQLYLMVQQGFSGKFVKTFFKDDINISSIDLDLMRCMALLMGEDFVLEHFYKREFSIEKARQTFGEHMAEKSVSQMSKINDLLHEQKYLRERFEMQMEFLKTEKESTKAHYKELMGKERENMRLEQELLRVQSEQAAKEAAAKEEGLLEENKKLNARLQETDQERQHLKDLCKEFKAQLQMDIKGSSDSVMELRKGFLQSFFGQLRKNRTKKVKYERNAYIRSVISNPGFSKGQLEVILDAVREGLPIGELEQICVPEMPPENMDLLKKYFMRYGGKKETTTTMEDGEHG